MNSWPAPSLCEIEEHFFLPKEASAFTSIHSQVLRWARLSETILTKGICNFFQSQRLNRNKDIVQQHRVEQPPDRHNCHRFIGEVLPRKRGLDLHFANCAR